MGRALSIAGAVALVFAVSAAHAKGPGGFGGGASSLSPHSLLTNNGPVTGYPGASGYAPGRQMQSPTNAPVTGYPGASGYAPGTKFKH